MEELLTVRELAKYLKLNPVTVLRKATKGEIPAIKIGKQFRFDKVQITKWLIQNTVGKIVRILVVDDEPVIGQVFTETLKEYSYQVTAVLSGKEALSLVTTTKYDLIFLDLVMPEIDGAELFRRIREIDKQVPVAIITGYPDSELMAKAMEHGPFIVMKKPFGGKEILEAIAFSIRYQRGRKTLGKDCAGD